MSSQALFDSFLEPAIAPTEVHVCAADVVECRSSHDAMIVQEIYRRPNDTLGFRYIAWVAWRDAGDTPRSHSWHALDTDRALVTDVIDTVRAVADNHAASKGLNLAPWSPL